MDLAVLVASLAFYRALSHLLDYFNWTAVSYYVDLIAKINLLLIVFDLLRRYWCLPLGRMALCQAFLGLLIGAGFYLGNYQIYDTARYLFVLNACAILFRLVTDASSPGD